MSFSNRWCIEGTLTTLTPLHVGSGDDMERPDIKDSPPNGDNSTKAQIAAVPTDYRGRAYIPGSAIKGNMRSWIMTHIEEAAEQGSAVYSAIGSTFGSKDPRDENALGGKVEFHDAFIEELPVLLKPPSYWSPERLTGVSTSVAIDRRRRTAVEKKLFYHEFVPQGVSFKVRLTAQDLNPGELDLILVALEGFNDPGDPVLLGAATGDGYGRFTWKPGNISRLEKGNDVIAWLNFYDGSTGYAAGLKPLSEAEQNEIMKKAREGYSIIPQSFPSLDISIKFEGPFLVNDPSRCQKRKDDREAAEDDSELPDHSPLRDHNGLAYLPGHSIRGAVRSQAERIIRTLKPGAACYSTDTLQCCQPVDDMNDVEQKLCLACQVFGASGWRSPVEFSDFHQATGDQVKFHQEMVAIDRFTGGAAKTAKFDADAVWEPVLKGTLTIDLTRMPVWGLGLIALVLRDLIEGDIPLGFGSTKGYGPCKANIDNIRTGITITPSTELQTILAQNGLNLTTITSLNLSTIPPEEVQLTVMDLIKAFHVKVSNYGREIPAKGRK